MTSTSDGSRPLNIILAHSEALRELAELLDPPNQGRLLSVCSLLEVVAQNIHAVAQEEVRRVGTNQAVVLRFDRG